MRMPWKKHPPGHPLHGYTGPDPSTVVVCLPCGSFRPDLACMMGMQQCMPFYNQPLYLGGCSAVNDARNRTAHIFLTAERFKHCDWTVWIDDDIGFTPQDWCYLMEGDDPFVSASYSKKTREGVKVTTGFGFVKVHRKVFDAIRDLLVEEGENKGAERVPRYFLEGDLRVDYFATGATGNAQWMGEDDGFIAWARLAGYAPKQEERCRLVHYGRYGYTLQEAERDNEVTHALSHLDKTCPRCAKAIDIHLRRDHQL